MALALHNLGALLKAKGDYDGAEPLYRESLTMRRKLLGETHPSVAASLNNLGVLLKEKGDRVGAAVMLRQAIDVNIASLGPEHPRVAITMVTLAELLYESGRYGEAEPLFLDALAIHRARGEENDSSVNAMYPRLYRLYRDWNKPEQAAMFESLAAEASPQAPDPSTAAPTREP